jgi:hypothetical protein
MRGLASFVMQGRAQAIAALCALTALSWFVSLASLLAAAAVALPTLRLGAREGATVIAFASLGVAAISGMLLGSLAPAGYALALWVPMWALAWLLRESGRLALALAGAAGLAMLMVVVIYLLADDPAKLWLGELQRFSQPFLEQGGSAAQVEALRRSFEAFARYLTGVVAAGSMLSLSLALLIARWWQAVLYNPGGFRAEFHALRFTPGGVYPWLALAGLAWGADGAVSEIAGNLVVPGSMLFLLAGFAVLHALCAASAQGGFWLAGIYLGLVFMSPLAGLVMLVGFSDVWLDWRRRLRAA